MEFCCKTISVPEKLSSSFRVVRNVCNSKYNFFPFLHEDVGWFRSVLVLHKHQFIVIYEYLKICTFTSIIMYVMQVITFWKPCRSRFPKSLSSLLYLLSENTLNILEKKKSFYQFLYIKIPLKISTNISNTKIQQYFY